MKEFWLQKPTPSRAEMPPGLQGAWHQPSQHAPCWPQRQVHPTPAPQEPRGRCGEEPAPARCGRSPRPRLERSAPCWRRPSCPPDATRPRERPEHNYCNGRLAPSFRPEARLCLGLMQSLAVATRMVHLMGLIRIFLWFLPDCGRGVVFLFFPSVLVWFVGFCPLPSVFFPFSPAGV